MHKHQQFNFFSNVIKYVRPTYGNKEELSPLKGENVAFVTDLEKQSAPHSLPYIVSGQFCEPAMSVCDIGIIPYSNDCFGLADPWP